MIWKYSQQYKAKGPYYGELLTEYRKYIRKTWQVLNTIINGPLIEQMTKVTLQITL